MAADPHDEQREDDQPMDRVPRIERRVRVAPCRVSDDGLSFLCGGVVDGDDGAPDAPGEGGQGEGLTPIRPSV